MAKGAENLARWRERADTRANALELEVKTFRENLLRDCGPNPLATRVAIVETVVSIYAATLRLRYAVIRGPKTEVQDVTERVSWLAGNMDRLLKRLELPPKPRPRTLADLVNRSTPQTVQNPASNV
jgi:hypothetical protein